VLLIRASIGRLKFMNNTKSSI